MQEMIEVKKASGWLVSGILALLAPLLCCIGPVLALLFGAGAATSAIAFADQYAGLFYGLAAVLLGYAGWKLFFKKRQKSSLVILESMLTCPKCGHQKVETMPTDACLYFYECTHCKALLKPQPGDCCVFCSYGTVKCPPIQQGDMHCC